jgi:hypothetical protein
MLVVVRSQVVCIRPLAELSRMFSALKKLHGSAHLLGFHLVLKDPLLIKGSSYVIIHSLLGCENITVVNMLKLLTIFAFYCEELSA